MNRPSPRAIEQDIEHTRAHLDATLDAIADKLSPMQLISQLMSFTKAGGGEFAGAVAGGLASAARTNPLPVTLLTVGAGWLMMANRGDHTSSSSNGARRWASQAGAKARETFNDARDRAQQATQHFEENMQTKAHDVQAKAHEMMDRAQAKAENLHRQFDQTRDSAMDAAQQNFQHLQEAAAQLLDQNPIAAGALMVALGALVGGALPVTERERQLFGRSGEKVRDTAMKAMERGAEAVKEVAGKTLEETRQTVEKVADEAREHAMH